MINRCATLFGLMFLSTLSAGLRSAFAFAEPSVASNPSHDAPLTFEI